MNRRPFLIPLLVLLIGQVAAAQAPRFELEPHPPFIRGIPFKLTVRALDADGAVDANFRGDAPIDVVDADGNVIPLPSPIVAIFDDATAGSVEIDGIRIPQEGKLVMRALDQQSSPIRMLPDWLSVAPALLSIVLAILFRQVVIALFLGVLFGVLILTGLDPFAMFTTTIDVYIVDALAERGHASILIFSLLLGGMVGVISRNGGTQGIVGFLTGYARTRRSAQVSTAALGGAIFFDDYANCLIVGNTMRPLTDRLRVSREKLSYIVDSTAAPVASLIPISTWVGYQVGQVEKGVAGIPEYAGTAYSLVLQSIPFMFYPLFALLLVFLITTLGRDAFFMLYAERRAHHEGKVIRDGGRPMAAGEEDEMMQAKPGTTPRMINSLLPILTVIGVTLFALVYLGIKGGAVLDQGFQRAVREIMAATDSYAALLWASLAGLLVAGVLSFIQRLLSLEEIVDSAVHGMKAMLLAVIILLLSWSLSSVADGLHTSDYLYSLAQRFEVQAQWLPLLVFFLSAATSFATGTAWGTMGIVMPLIIPVALSLAVGLDPSIATPHLILLGCISAVLGGAVFGDHCSPISDTTVLSSTATSCDHIDHVRTQLPYAVIGGILAVCSGYLPIAYGYSTWITIPIGIVAAILIVRFLFRPVVRDRDVVVGTAAE